MIELVANRWTNDAARRALSRIRSAFGDTAGGIAVMIALFLPILLLATGSVIDYGFLVNQRTEAQNSADAAAIAGAKELSLADASKSNISAVVNAVVAAYFAQNEKLRVKDYSVVSNVIDTKNEPLQVEVTLAATIESFFGSQFGFGDKAINVRSVAVVVGKPNVCLLALDPSSAGTLYLTKNARIVGQDCAVYSNSDHPNGIKSFNNSMLSADFICSAGGSDGGKGNFSPAPLADCPQFEDPLSGRPEPAPGACEANDLVIKDQTRTLTPGTYCGGITLTGTSRVTFEPGVYVLQDGPLLVADTAIAEGENAGFYFVGDLARFSFATGSTISLTAPKDGPMAGILFFASRSQTKVKHEIFSDNARQLLGTIYLPTGELSIDANQPIADQSAYTAIVARTVRANAGPTVTLNTNFDSTDVPVPDGIRGAGQPISLAR